MRLTHVQVERLPVGDGGVVSSVVESKVDGKRLGTSFVEGSNASSILMAPIVMVPSSVLSMSEGILSLI